jgi:flagellar biosynthesis protein FliQ
MPATTFLTEAATLTLWLSAPALAAALLISLLGAPLLALLKLDDPIVRAVPRSVVTWFVVLSCAGYASSELTGFARRAYASLLELPR